MTPEELREAAFFWLGVAESSFHASAFEQSSAATALANLHIQLYRIERES